MPWCPRCDETFPQGPACPRCSARLVAREREVPDDPLTAVPGLRSIRVSRRDRRALERLSGPRAPSSRALALALILLVFASGYLLGRVASIAPSQPTVRALPLAEPISYEAVEGSVAYVVSSREPLNTIAVHHLSSGDVSPRARFSSPFEATEHFVTKVVSYGRSVAAVVEHDGEGYIALAPHGRAATVGLRGVDVAWTSESELLVRQADGAIVRWTSGAESVDSMPLGDGEELVQTRSGAVVRRGGALEALGSSKRRLDVPEHADVIAVSADMSRAIIGKSRPALWDGRDVVAVREGKGKVLGASFDASGEHAAIVRRSGEELFLTIVDADGNAAVKPLGGGLGCEGPPAWDGAGRWVYVASGGGVLHAVEAAGGHIEAVKTNGVGCGVAWVDTA